jgi:hypothetical protein
LTIKTLLLRHVHGALDNGRMQSCLQVALLTALTYSSMCMLLLQLDLPPHIYHA